jgi:RHH-type proline utilization regulon transcriptional repressor/proline dehydrogenase/delta 1-pyrroline-5-carboxylate dehydrogenase
LGIRKIKENVMDKFKNEPLAQFIDQSERDAFKSALDKVRASFGKSYQLVIGGKEYLGKDSPIVSVNPSRTSEIVGTVAAASEGQAAMAVFQAKEALREWRKTTLASRVAVLRNAAASMRENKFEWCAWLLSENGKSWRESDIEVCECIDFLEYYALEAERVWPTRLGADMGLDVAGEENKYFYQPRGVCVVIAPWNFPLAILTGMAAAALVTGNTVILKPAEQTSVIARLVHDLFASAGTPAGVVNYLPGRGETVGAFLVKHPSVNVVAFTGSKPVGLMINENAGHTLMAQQSVKKVICEMGGKNAIIVDEDADLDEAITGVMKSAFNYSGQKCSACSRVICVGSAYEPFKLRLIEAVKGLCVAPADDPNCVVSPVIDEAARQNILKYIGIAKGEGLTAVYERNADVSMGTYPDIAVFDNVQPWHRIAQEEIFGPVLSLMKADDFDTAINIATDVEFALTGAVYSRSPDNISKAIDDFRVGNLYINRGCTGAYVGRQPFGGFKMSGIGMKAGGPDYLLQFVEPRTVTENTMRRGFAPNAR